MESVTEDDTRWVEISKDFLQQNFIEPFVVKQEEEALDKRIDMDKLSYKTTPYDAQYYHDKFPNFDKSVCEILEKCSIEKERAMHNPNKKKLIKEHQRLGFQKFNKKVLVDFQ
jgi:hypothetical protein